MARYVSDQNKVVMLHESGTYATASGNGFWIGQVTENSIEDAEGHITDRYLGAASRSLSNVELGPRDVNGTISFHPQDGKMILLAIGSVCDTSGTYSIHTATQINTDVRQSGFTSGTLNPPFSFTIEDSKQAPGTGKNLIRTVNGCVFDNLSIEANQNEKVLVTANYIGQTLTFSSGTTTAVTSHTNRAFAWSDMSLTVAGSTLGTAKSVKFDINQNIQAQHYIGSSRDIAIPVPGNRDYLLTVTSDMGADDGNLLYEDLYKSNATFNCTLDINADGKSGTLGSQHIVIYMSGCKITNTPTVPSPAEGMNESTFEIVPQNVNGQSWDSVSGASKYNPW